MPSRILLGPTLPSFWTFNPAYAQVQNEHVWAVAWADIITGGMTPESAAEKAFKRVEEIFAKYPIAPRTRRGKEGAMTHSSSRAFQYFAASSGP